MATETHIVHGIYFHATASTAKPPLPAAGANYSQATLSAASFTTIGSRDQQSHDCDLDEDTFSLAMGHTTELIQPPRGQAPEDEVILQIFGDQWEFTCYDASEVLWTLASTASVTSSGVATFSEANLTARTCIVEVRNKFIVYYPKVYLKPVDLGLGAASGGVARSTFQVRPLRTAALPTGFRIQWKQ